MTSHTTTTSSTPVPHPTESHTHTHTPDLTPGTTTATLLLSPAWKGKLPTHTVAYCTTCHGVIALDRQTRTDWHLVRPGSALEGAATTALGRLAEWNAAHDRIKAMVVTLTALTGITWSFGYIGDLTPSGSDYRSWYAFAEHQGRVGNASDRIGGVPTAEVPSLIPVLAGAIALARVLGAPRVVGTEARSWSPLAQRPTLVNTSAARVASSDSPAAL